MEKYWRAKNESANDAKVFSSWGELTEFEWELREREEKNIVETINNLWREAEQEEQSGNLFSLRQTLSEFLTLTSAENLSRQISLTDLQWRRNAAFDKLDALTALEQGSPASLIQKYLNARSLYDTQIPSVGILESLSELRTDKNLKDNVAYLEAATLYRLQDEKAADAFAKIAVNFFKSEKREAALFMYAVVTMKRSKVFTGDKRESLCQDCPDDYLLKAQSAFQRFLSEFPQGRYWGDALGWLAYLSFKTGNKVRALANYYRMLGSQNESAKVEALFSLNFVRNHANDDELRQVESEIEDEPKAALAYAYHNLYNYAPFRAIDWEDDEEQRKIKISREYRRIVEFANRMVNRHPKNSTGGAFMVRLAEGNFELEKFSEAAQYARQALRLGINKELRAEALWVAGVAEYHLKQYPTARVALATLIKENPNNRYTEGARRNLAMLEEDAGNLEAALEQYLALDYRHDAAYFCEVLMKTEQLAKFIDSRQNLKNRDELLYVLGLRYLRDFRWEDARKIFSGIRPTGRSVDGSYLNDTNYYNYGEQESEVKLRLFDPHIRGIRPQWLEQDLRTTDELQRLDNNYRLATDDESRAEALYQFASFIYQSSLLFYNPVWRNNRHYMLYEFFEYGAFRQANESQLLFDYMQKHDMAARALEIYLEVVKKYPNTRAARDALYTAAVCHERLREYNNYWREIYAEGGHAGERMVTYKEVKRSYPDYRFPLGTLGWEPATRTVNGGPGWADLPKPKPKPTLKERALRYAKATAKLARKKIRKTFWFGVNLLLTSLKMLWAFTYGVYKCLWFGCAFVFTCLLYKWASEARWLLRDELARCESRPRKTAEEKETAGDAILLSTNLTKKGEIEPLLSRLDAYLNKDLRDEWKVYAQDIYYKIKQLKQYERGKSLLALSAATHLLLGILLIQLLGAYK
ncbi:MAG: tetratricopeptide repeat protein [Acidobacteriota bacterium]